MFDQIDQEKDEREELRRKVKLLEAQIVERTRNFMQNGRSRTKPPSSPVSKTMFEQAIQTDNVSNINQVSIPQEQQTSALTQLMTSAQNEIYQKIAEISKNAKKQPLNQKNPNNDKSTSDRKNVQLLSNLTAPIFQLLRNFILPASSPSQFTTSPYSSPSTSPSKYPFLPSSLLIQTFKYQYISGLTPVLTHMSSLASTSRQQQKLSSALEKVQNKLRQSEVRCQLITKALHQSEEANYLLRLRIQEADAKMRDFVDTKAKYSEELEKYQTENATMKSKIQQMDVMKKEYLRAYSKVKQEKEQLQFKIIDIEEQCYKKLLLGNLQSSGSNSINLNPIFQQSEQQRRLSRTKIEQQTSLTAIKQIMQNSLMQPNRSLSQKWIKSALLKLENYQQTQFQQSQNSIKSKKNIQTTLHQNYAILINNISKAWTNRIQHMQDNFNIMMDKIVQNGHVDSDPADDRDCGSVRGRAISQDCEEFYQECRNSGNGCGHQENQDEKNGEVQTNTYELLSKLNQSYIKFNQLKKKYDFLLLHQEEHKYLSQPTTLDKQRHFNKMMDKIISYQLRQLNQKSTNTTKNYITTTTTTSNDNNNNNNKDNDNKQNSQLLNKLAHLMFETVCNLPTSPGQQLFFVPSCLSELENALDIIYRFSLNYHQIQEEKLKQWRNEVNSLTRVLEDIVVAKDVPVEMLIASMNINMNEEGSIGAECVKVLIHKIMSGDKQTIYRGVESSSSSEKSVETGKIESLEDREKI